MNKVRYLFLLCCLIKLDILLSMEEEPIDTIEPSSSDDDFSNKCPICSCSLKKQETIVLSCSAENPEATQHIFHKTCLLNAITTHKKNYKEEEPSCPTCRHLICNRDLIIIGYLKEDVPDDCCLLM